VQVEGALNVNWQEIFVDGGYMGGFDLN